MHTINIHNRKASYEYNIQDEYICGIMLFGTEVKSIRENGCNISAAYCYVKENAVFIKNMHISNIKNTKNIEHDVLRERKLLLTKKEIRKLKVELKNIGLTLIPISVFNKQGLIKIKIGIGKGKKLYDKRNSLKEKELERRINKKED